MSMRNVPASIRCIKKPSGSIRNGIDPGQNSRAANRQRRKSR